MSKIVRKLQKIFAIDAANNGQFGSAQLGTKVLSNDLDTLQNLPAWENGWLDAVVSPQTLPTLEEMQATNYINTYQLKYLFQEGIPEFLVTETYYQNSIVKKGGTYELYGSIVDDNTGNALTDATKWKYLGNLEGLVTSNEISSTDSQLVLFSGTTGQVIKKSALSGLLKAASGVVSAAVAGTDYLTPTGDGSQLTGINVAAGVAPYLSSPQTITNAGTLTLAHGLGSTPARWGVSYLECQTGEFGYTAGQKAIPLVDHNTTGGNGYTAGIVADGTNLSVKYGSSGFGIINFTNGQFANATSANWKAIFYASRI